MHSFTLLAAETLPIDVTSLVGVTLSMIMLIIPVAGLTIRFAARPVVEALQRLGLDLSSRGASSTGGASAKQVELLANRVLELEQEVAKLKGLPARTAAALPSALAPAPVAPVGEGRDGRALGSGDRLEQ